MFTVDIEGQEVRCEIIGGKRAWTCWCDYFQKRRTGRTPSAAYCPHTATAIMRCIQDGSIDPEDAAAGEFERFVNRAGGLL